MSNKVQLDVAKGRSFRLGSFSAISSSSSKPSLQHVLLHGTLEVMIHEACCLPNMDACHERTQNLCTLLAPLTKPFWNKNKNKNKNTEDVYMGEEEERHIQHVKKKRSITTDPYVCVMLRDATIARTRVISNEQNPIWEEHFSIPVAHETIHVGFLVKDNDILGAQRIGEAKILASNLIQTEFVEQWFPLLNKDGKPCYPDAQLKLSVKFVSAEEDQQYKTTYIGGGFDAYFGLRKGCRITLYQDADLQENCRLPAISLDGGIAYQYKSCWEEICTAIQEAHHLIYIAGWSIYTQTRLLRKPNKLVATPGAECPTLGDLLRHKSRELVRILLLVWDDKTSHRFFKNRGVMGTHDEETRRFFKHSSVECLLAPRYADSKLSWFKQKVVGTLYTHHQKLVIVDSQGPGNFRKLTAFVGGLDLCNGRYDTPEHRLFRSLHETFENDYHNPAFATNADAGGPRQPWHDLHCKIEGPAAYDVLTNFEQRWRKVLRLKLRKQFRKVIKTKDDYLANLDNISWILSRKKKETTSHVTEDKDEYDTDDDNHLMVTDEDSPDTWNAQVFRSIDSGSVKGFPKNAVDAEKRHLVCGKNVAIDMSIHNAYIKAIRSAQHFIYIENQYFIGSSFAWPDYRNAGANHLIPIELALKIASKIKLNERFAVYIVIPMWPEGVPTDNAVQEILYFQGQTMEMMYKIIADALREVKMEDKHHPTDYLNFFCLGNRELKNDDEKDPIIKPADNSIQAIVQKTRRFMIYVHAKGMIIDDEYVILGSANINQRSMDGSRDTEIAVGAFQPHHAWAKGNIQPRGQVHGYRMSLWYEHMAKTEECFLEPWTLECVKMVRSISEEYWKQYTDEKITEMHGHLLPYPVKVDSSGKVLPLPEFEFFPDVGGRVLGNSAVGMPDTLTT